MGQRDIGHTGPHERHQEACKAEQFPVTSDEVAVLSQMRPGERKQDQHARRPAHEAERVGWRVARSPAADHVIDGENQHRNQHHHMGDAFAARRSGCICICHCGQSSMGNQSYCRRPENGTRSDVETAYRPVETASNIPDGAAKAKSIVSPLIFPEDRSLLKRRTRVGTWPKQLLLDQQICR